VNSLTALTAELEGRHYGGGVLELVPSEIRRLLVPVRSATEATVNRLDAMIRRAVESDVLLAKQDNSILNRIGFTKQESEELLNAWSRLRLRRQRQKVDGLDDVERDKPI